jgi:acyl-CoA hydrolase
MAPPARPPSASVSVLTRWMGVADANTAGNVHGGRIMYLCDEVAGIAAIRHSGRRVVTAGVDRMIFLHPVLVGDLVTVRATVNAAWRTSMEVGVRVEREQVQTGEVEHTSTAYLTMVALDEDRRPVEVPPIELASEVERRRQAEAELRRRNRLGEREEIVRGRGGDS